MMKEYLDYNATTPVSAETAEVIKQYLIDDYGNAGSRTHESGSKAKAAILESRKLVASYLDAEYSEIIFTSGATESNNIALFGLLDYAQQNNKSHIISTTIEHKAILDPLNEIESRGFEITLIDPDENGKINPDDVLQAIKHETFLISCMHANNETGVINPITEIAEQVKNKNEAIFFHSDCSQTFGKTSLDLTSDSIDMISFSAHKFYGPKGIGGLLARKKDGKSMPLKPLMFGGGQEKGLRPGTHPVHLIAGMNHALNLCIQQKDKWEERCSKIKQIALDAFKDLDVKVYGGTDKNVLPNTLSISFSDLDAEALIVHIRDIAEISTGSACTSESYTPSHVLMAMGLSEDEATQVVRLSWGPDSNADIFENIAKLVKEII